MQQSARVLKASAPPSFNRLGGGGSGGARWIDAATGVGEDQNAMDLFTATVPLSPTKRMWTNVLPDESTAGDMDDAYSEWHGECVREEGVRRHFRGVVLVQSSGDVTRFSVGDDALVLAPKGMLPYIAKIEDMFEVEGDDDKTVCLRWYYRSSEVTRKKDGKPISSKEVFASNYTDENSIQSILRKCYVLPHKLYVSERGEQFKDVFFCRQTFSPPTKHFGDASHHFASRDWQQIIDDLAKRRSDMLYQEPKMGPAHQCPVPLSTVRGRYAPSPGRGEDELLFSPTKAFGAQGKPSEAAEAFLKEWEDLVPASAGVNRQKCLVALSSCGGDVSKARDRMCSLKANGVPGFESGDRAGVHQSWRYSLGEHAEMVAAQISSGRAPPKSGSEGAATNQEDPSPPAGASRPESSPHPVTPQQDPSPAAAPSPSEVTPPPHNPSPPPVLPCSLLAAPPQGGGVVGRGGEGAGQASGGGKKKTGGSHSSCPNVQAAAASWPGMPRANSAGHAGASADPACAQRACGGSASVRGSNSVVAGRKRMSAFKGPPTFKRVADGASEGKEGGEKRDVGGAGTERDREEEEKMKRRERAKEQGGVGSSQRLGEADTMPGTPEPEEEPIFVGQAKCYDDGAYYECVIGLDTCKGKMVMFMGFEGEKWQDTRVKDIKNMAKEGEIAGVCPKKRSKQEPAGGGDKETCEQSRGLARAGDGSVAKKSEGAEHSERAERRRGAQNGSMEDEEEGGTEEQEREDVGTKRRRRSGAEEGDDGRGGRANGGVVRSSWHWAGRRVLPNYTGPSSVAWNGYVWQIGDCVVIKSEFKTKDYLACILGFSFEGTEPMIKCGWFYLKADVPAAHRRLRVGTNQEVPLEMSNREVMVSTHSDVNSIQSIKGPCRVFHEEEYLRLLKETKQKHHTYFFRRLYDTKKGVCRPAGPEWRPGGALKFQ